MAYINNDRYSQKGKSNSGQQNKKQYPLNKDFCNPYAFVPFSNKIYNLSKEEERELETVHDIPVQDSLSGRIYVDFEAQTPFCVRKGTDNHNINVEGNYYVPGSTIKGMIRSVLDILALSNAKNGIANNRYSMRDLRSSDYCLKANEKPQKAGFLIKIKGKYYIHECYEYAPWRYEDIEQHVRKYGLRQQKSIKDKYKLIDKFTNDRDGYLAMWLFSGFMNNKKHEFLLSLPEFKESDLIPIKQDEWEDFIFIHEKENTNPSWTFWRSNLHNYDTVGEINEEKKPSIAPCFFRIKEDRREIKDLGFSFLYRQPYEKKVHDFLPKEHTTTHGLDLGDAIFGYVRGNKALKGRVVFGAAFVKDAKVLDEQTFIMGSPKPTYYPFYLQQNKRSGEKLNTYFNNSQLNGAKRYVLQSEAKKGEVTKSRVTTSFCPIDKGAHFTTCIMFHNLHDYELGALIAAITFCNRTDCYHSMGFAKPLGYGRIKVKKCSIKDCERTDVPELIENFKSKLFDRCGITTKEWENAVDKLFKLASFIHGEKDKIVRYPIMDNKEFENIKNKKYSLADFEE